MPPLGALSAEQEAAGLKKLEKDAACILDDKGVPAAVQGRLGHIGVTSLDVFAVIEDTSAGVRQWLVDVLGLDPDADLESRTNIAKVIAAWQASKKRVSTQDSLEAEQRSSKIPKTIMKGKHVEMRAAYVAAHRGGVVPDDKEMPSAAYVEAAIDQMEDGEFQVEPLSEVTTLEELQDEVLTAGELKMGSDGRLQFKRQKQTAREPTNSEQLRHRHRVMAVRWMMLTQRYPNRDVLKANDHDMWRLLSDYVLGPEVMGFEFKAPNGQIVGRPSWTQVLHYEFHIRKKALKTVNMKGTNLKDALMDAMTSEHLKNKEFLTPATTSVAVAAVHSAEASAPVAAPGAANLNWQPRSSGARAQAPPPGPPPADSGHPSSRNQFKRQILSWHPDHGYICSPWQRNRCEGNCGMAHKCAFCLADHQAFVSCPFRPAPQQAAGKGQKGAQKGARGGKGRGRWGGGRKGGGRWQR